MNKITRETGYYWVKIKRTGLWVIAKWMQSYGWFDFMLLENDIRNTVCEVDERRIIHYEEKTIIKRKRTK